MARILAALSGGVDSAAATALLVEQGHDVVGAYMKNWINEDNITGHCPWEQDIVDARAVADTLGIEFRIVNLMREYQERVVDYLLEGYKRGITPNPDVMCNREMKLGVFKDYALAEGFEKVATGHYAQTEAHEDGSVSIRRGADSNKDQTYFLALLLQNQAQFASFPVGHLPKPEVRQVASRFNLPNATKKDSQGICFIGEIKMSDFLSAFVDENPGPIITHDGTVVGNHRGLHLYTLGQRRGIGVASNTFKKPFVVIEKRHANNQLVVGFDEAKTPKLYASHCTVSQITFVNRPFEDRSILVQPRYRTPAVPVSIAQFENHCAKVTFHNPQRALTPGQICAFYDGTELIGGGIFESIEHAEV